ncbi:MAG: DUF2177 family protein [Pseudomonadota bacterium]|nr:DUF2177 family protein [Pseudomonadota bacterium]
MAYLFVYLVALTLFLGIDYVWLTQMVERFYRPEIGALMRDQPNMLAAGGFYLFYILALMILVIVPQLRQGGSLGRVFALGTIAGAFAYGTYDFTNLATLEGWTLKMTLGDLAWGTVLTGTVSVGTVAIARCFGWLARRTVA